MSDIFINQRIEDRPERRVGNTTRLIDLTIQTLFTAKHCLISFNHLAELERFENILHRRMITEHNSAMTVKNRDALWDDIMDRGKIYRLVYNRINTTSVEALRGRHYRDKDDTDQAMLNLLNTTKIPLLSIELQYK